MPTAVDLKNADRFRRLVDQSNLSAVILAYRERGYRILVATEASSYIGTVFDRQNTIWFKFNDIDNLAPQVPEVEAFVAVILHELGHIEALERGLDPEDEILAWKIAEEICPFALPVTWKITKQAGLDTRLLRQRGEALSLEQATQLGHYNICPNCGRGKFAVDPDTMDVGPDKPGDIIMMCGQCRNQFCISWQNGKVVGGWLWVLEKR